MLELSLSDTPSDGPLTFKQAWKKKKDLPANLQHSRISFVSGWIFWVLFGFSAPQWSVKS